MPFNTTEQAFLRPLKETQCDPEEAYRLIPFHATKGSVGVDLRADLSEPLKLKKGEVYLIPTGYSLRIPQNYCALCLPRSGSDFMIFNSPGLIDKDYYPGELKVKVYAVKACEVKPFDRIAQLIVIPYLAIGGAQEGGMARKGGFGSTDEISAETVSVDNASEVSFNAYDEDRGEDENEILGEERDEDSTY